MSRQWGWKQDNSQSGRFRDPREDGRLGREESERGERQTGDRQTDRDREMHKGQREGERGRIRETKRDTQHSQQVVTDEGRRQRWKETEG